MAIKIYTNTKHLKVGNTYVSKMYGTIQGPIHTMLKHYPKEFAFMRHETKRSLRPSARGKKNKWVIKNIYDQKI